MISKTNISAFVKFAFIMLQVSAMAACAPRNYQVYNETGEDVLVRMFRRDDEFMATLDYKYIKDGDIKDFKYPSTPCGFEVILPDRTWRYEHVNHKTKSFPVDSINLRVEHDGRMYRYYTSRSIPDLRQHPERVQRYVQQPEGYPCLPQIIPRGLMDRYQ